MAKKKLKDAFNDRTSEVQGVQSDDEFLSDETQRSDLKGNVASSRTHKQFVENEGFIDNEEFQKLSKVSIENTDRKPSVDTPSFFKVLNRYTRFTFIQKILAINIVIVASILVYSVLIYLKGTRTSSTQKSTSHRMLSVPQKSMSKPSTLETPKTVREQVQKQRLVLSPKQPISLEVANSFYMREEYNKAYAVYDLLRQALPTGDELLSDFFQLKMALCAKEATYFEQANRLLTMVSHSRSPVVRIMANYHLIALDIQRNRFLRARTRAYNAIALIKAVDFDDDWALSFESDCHFLVAECLTRRILFFIDIDSDYPSDLWSGPTLSSFPFKNLSGIGLRKLLNAGTEHLSEALLGPKIRNLEYTNKAPRWSVTSYRAPLEELMVKFAVNADIDISWTSKENADLVSGKDVIRQRPITLYLPAATSHQIVLTAAGCAGLMARIEDNSDKQRVTIYDPIEYSSLNEYLSLLSRQAISLWQEFSLTFHNDKRLANAHYAMGLLKSQIGLQTEAIAEYKLVANRFPHTSLAPFALLNSSELKTNYRDYQGAREDLKQLIEQYPDTDLYEQAYLRLADATMEAGLKAEAARLYKRLYNYAFSSKSRTISALRAASCLYETAAYEEAIKWLMRYINLVRDDNPNNLSSAYFLLGRTNLALKKYQEACDAFQYVLTKKNSSEQNIQAILALVQSHLEQEHFIEALDALENIRSIALSQEQSVEISLLRSKIFRMLGLIDEAIISLRDMTEYVSDTQLEARISFELAQCYMAKDDLEHARSSLSEILSVVDPGPLAQEAALALADASVKLDQGKQAISVCLKLLESNPSEEIKQNTLTLLARAYREQEEYDKAALALSGQWE